MEARWPPRSQQLFGGPPKDQALPLDPKLSDQLSSMGQEISHLLLRAGPPKEFEVLRPGPPQPTVRRLAFEESSKVSPRTAVPSRPPKSEAPIPDGAVTSMCSRCHVLNMQVRALAQSLAGLGAKAFNWSTGLGKLQRRDLAEVVLEYCRPCAHLDTTLEGLCIDLENIQWGEVASLGSVAQLAPPPDWMSQAREAETQTTPRPSVGKAKLKEEAVPKVAIPAAVPASSPVEPPHTAKIEPAPVAPSLPLNETATVLGGMGWQVPEAEAQPLAVQQRLQEILQQGQQQRLDVESLQELQKLLSVVAETPRGPADENASVQSDASPKDASWPLCPQRSSSPRNLTRALRPGPENHDLPLLVPRQQDLPPRHPPALQAPLTPHPAVGPGTPRSARSATPPPNATGTLVPQRALGREAKTCSDLLGDVKPAGDPRDQEVLGATQAEVAHHHVSDVKPAGDPRDQEVLGAEDQVTEAQRGATQKPSGQKLSGAAQQELPRVSGYAPSELWDSHRPSGMPPDTPSSQRLSGMVTSAQRELEPRASGVPDSRPSGLKPVEAEMQRQSGVPPASQSQRPSGLQPAEAEMQRQSGMLSATQPQRLSGTPADSQLQRPSGLQPAAAETQRQSGMLSATQSHRPSGTPADSQLQRPSGLQPATAETQRQSGMLSATQSHRPSGGAALPLESQRRSGEAAPTTKLDVQMASTAAVGGSFEVSPAAASTQVAETTPGGASGPDDDAWDDGGAMAPEEVERSVGAEATLSAPQIQVKAPEGDATETQAESAVPQVQHTSSGLSSHKAAAAAATKKTSRFTFSLMGRNSSKKS